MNMKFTYFMAFCAVTTFGAYPSQEKQRPLTLAESTVIGGVVGAAEVALPGQILSYGMNKAIKKEKFVWRDSYKGFAANAVGQMPITAVQKVVQVKGSQYIEVLQGCPLSDGQKVGVSFASGIGGAFIDTPSNAVQLYLQDKSNSGKSTWRAVKELKRQCFRGFASNAFIKEGPFAVGYQFLAPKGTQAALQYVEIPEVATAFGGAAAGVFTAVLTQPGAVLRNKMQNDTAGTTYRATWQTVQKILKEEGWKGLFTGLKQRGTRVAFAVPLYVMYGAALEGQIRK
ncbi:MAG: hypothetical protein NTZ68_00150 [Candidatus Dependentiae bacterium]|nr:hypothetical protein [Candidatus Dependentiae bacterium]